LHFKNKNSRL